MGTLIVPTGLVGGAASGSWAGWDEASESTLLVDQDGDGTEDTFICLFENTSAGGNETGRGGGLAGADLVLTQAGNVAGASGGSRTLDGGNDYFHFTTNLSNLIINASDTFSIIIKAEDVNAGLLDHVLDLVGPGPLGSHDRVWMRSHNVDARRLYTLVRRDNSAKLTDTTTDQWPSSGVVYFGLWSDGSNIRSGFKETTKPTKWSDFGINDRMSNASAIGFSDDDLSGFRNIGSYENGAGNFMPMKLHYVVISSVCLIDNAA